MLVRLMSRVIGARALILKDGLGVKRALESCVQPSICRPGPSLNVNGVGTLRLLSSNPIAKTTPKPEQEEKKEESEWITVYRFNHILVARAIQRFKVYQTIFSVGIILPITVGFSHGVVTTTDVISVLGASLFTCGVLYSIGNIFSRIIAIIYTSRVDPSLVKVAHLTFWGNRKDDICRAEDFYALGDLEYKPKDVYIHLKQYSRYTKFYYFTARYGTVYNRDEFERIFGTIPSDLPLKVVDELPVPNK